MYSVDMDVTIAVRMWIDANSQEEAEKIALDKVLKETNYHVSHGVFVGAEVVECYEEEE